MLRQSEPTYPDAKSPTSFRDGVEYQDFVCEQLGKRGFIIQTFASKRYQLERGESLTGVEIKLDSRCAQTSRLSIEVAEKSSASVADWTASGIMREDNAFLYLQGNHEVVFLFSKKHLRRYYMQKAPDVEEKRGTIRTFYLPFDLAERMAVTVFRLGGAP